MRVKPLSSARSWMQANRFHARVPGDRRRRQYPFFFPDAKRCVVRFDAMSLPSVSFESLSAQHGRANQHYFAGVRVQRLGVLHWRLGTSLLMYSISASVNVQRQFKLQPSATVAVYFQSNESAFTEIAPMGTAQGARACKLRSIGTMRQVVQ